MSTGSTILLVSIFLFMDMMVVGAVFSMAIEPIKRLAQKHPGRPLIEPFTRREFASVRIGLGNFGKCVHLTVDREYLHLEPAAIMRFMGMPAVSVPRAEVLIPEGEPTGVFEKGLEVKIEREPIRLPAWCIEALRSEHET